MNNQPLLVLLLAYCQILPTSKYQQTSKVLNDVPRKGLELTCTITQCHCLLAAFLRMLGGSCSTIHLENWCGTLGISLESSNIAWNYNTNAVWHFQTLRGIIMFSKSPVRSFLLSKPYLQVCTMVLRL